MPAMDNLFPLESTWMLAAAAGIVVLLMSWRLSRALPLQNLLMIVVCLLVGETLLEWLVTKIGRIDLPDPIWRYLLGAALLWTAVALTARRLAKLIARPWRREKVHWLWILALSAVGTGAFQFGWPLLDPDFVMQKKVALMALVRGAGTGVLLGLLGPWFLRKRPFPGQDSSELADEPQDEAEQQA
jgi:hypothetical protein